MILFESKLGHDYLFFANLKAYDAPWLRLCSVVESAIGNPRLYREKSHASGFRGRSYTGNYASNEKQDLFLFGLIRDL